VSDLEEFEVIEATLVSFESSSDGFHLSPDIDEGFTFDVGEIGRHVANCSLWIEMLHDRAKLRKEDFRKKPIA